MSDEYIQLIFCVESTEKAAIDSKYINQVINQYYNVGENKISYVYMSGKFNYNHSKILKKINKFVNDYKVTGNGESYVIYVFDKDLNTQDHRDTQFENNVKKYCKEQIHQLIWFIKTVEDVMWGSKVGKKEKKQKALQFISRHQIEKIKKVNLEALANVNASHKSNILTVLNKYSQIK
jgi:hypothetical protein